MATKATASVTLAWSAGIVATFRYYQLTAPTAATPAVPTSSSSLGSWSETEPTADVTKVLWTCERTVYADGTESWSKASKSTSYEVAKDAKSMADAAKSTARNAQNTANATATLIRQYSGGVLVAKTGAKVGALVNAIGSFDVVKLTWSNGVPSVAGTLSSFDADNISIGAGENKITFTHETIDGSNVATIIGPDQSDSIMLKPSADSDASIFITGSKNEIDSSFFEVQADKIVLTNSTGDAIESSIYTMHGVKKLLGSRWESASVTLNTSSSLLGAHSASCLINPGLGLAHLAIDMSFDSPGWQPGTSTWLFRLPSGLRPFEEKRLYNLIQIYINGRWGAHVDVHPDGYCYPTWGWQATNIVCNMVFPLALLGL